MKFVFVGGCPRSGTTLTAHLLGRAGGVLTTPEAPFKQDLLRITSQYDDPVQVARAVCDFLHSSDRFRIWKTTLEPVELAGELAHHSGLGGVLAAIARQFARSHGLSPDVDVVVEHYPGNVKHAYGLRDALPDARFIHVVRDGRAILGSFRNLDWGPTSPVRAAQYWLSNLSYGLALESSGVAQRLVYEDLVRSPDHTLAALKKVWGWSGEIASSSNSWLPDYTKGQHRLVEGPMDPSRVDGWRATLPRRDVEIFEAYAGGMLDTLGYSRVHASPRRPEPIESAWLKLYDIWVSRRKRRRQRARMRRHAR